MMSVFITSMQVFNPESNQLEWVEGPIIEAPNADLAQEIALCEYGSWLFVSYELLMEEFEEGDLGPEWGHMIDLTKVYLN